MKYFALALCVTLPAAAATVDPALLALAPPGAKVLAGIQASKIESSPLGRYLKSQIQLDAAAEGLMATLGVDPQELVVSSDGLLGDATVAARLLRPASPGAPTYVYHGAAVLEAKRDGNNQSGAIAWIDPTIVVAGGTDSVKAAIDRHAAHAGFSGPLAEQARRLSSSNEAWIVWSAPASSLPAAVSGQLGAFANAAQAALQISAGLKLAPEQATLSADILTRSPQDAQSMADVLKFAIGMLQSNRAQSPAPPLAANAAEISARGSVTHVVVSVPERQLEQLLLPKQPKKVAAR